MAIPAQLCATLSLSLNHIVYAGKYRHTGFSHIGVRVSELPILKVQIQRQQLHYIARATSKLLIAMLIS
jgi:hypothetical protein